MWQTLARTAVPRRNRPAHPPRRPPSGRPRSDRARADAEAPAGAAGRGARGRRTNQPGPPRPPLPEPGRRDTMAVTIGAPASLRMSQPHMALPAVTGAAEADPLRAALDAVYAAVAAYRRGPPGTAEEIRSVSAGRPEAPTSCRSDASCGVRHRCRLHPHRGHHHRGERLIQDPRPKKSAAGRRLVVYRSTW